MKRAWLLASIGVGMALGLNSVNADERGAPGVAVVGQHGTLPPPCPPGQVAPSAPIPASPAPVAMAPTTEMYAQAPASGTPGGDSFNPNMIGDLIAGNYAAAPVSRDGFVAALVPQVQRGSFKISDNENPRPQDRFFVAYNYFDNVHAPAVRNVQGAFVRDRLSYDVHRETYGFEKTFLDGIASIGLRVNTIQSQGNIQKSEFGDMTVVTKLTLLERDNLYVSVGVAATIPTGTPIDNVLGDDYRSVLMQPFSGFILSGEKWFLQGFGALILGTDPDDPTLATADYGLGYWLYRNCDQGAFLRYVVPMAEAHFNTALSKEGWANRVDYAMPNSAIVTGGIAFGLGCGANLTIGMATPLSGPRIMDFEGIAQLNWQF